MLVLKYVVICIDTFLCFKLQKVFGNLLVKIAPGASPTEINCSWPFNDEVSYMYCLNMLQMFNDICII